MYNSIGSLQRSVQEIFSPQDEFDPVIWGCFVQHISLSFAFLDMDMVSVAKYSIS